jgi:hypothetical protein
LFLSPLSVRAVKDDRGGWERKVYCSSPVDQEGDAGDVGVFPRSSGLLLDRATQ